jgi:long-subunit acyl-CoA synthetase (AMP-forming)
VPKALGSAHPDAFFSTPRFWEKLQVAIEGMIEAQPDESQRATMREAVETGLVAVRAAERGSGATPAEIEALARDHQHALRLLRPLLERLGLDRIKAAYIGGAPSPGELSQFFRAVGVPMLEAYGLTEGCLNVFNRVEDFKSGTAGRPLPGVELKLADDGEILVRGELNFVGYRKEPEATARTFDAEGWLRTGDIASMDDEGFVRIIDRKKEIIINAAGKNMSPVLIESAVKAETSLLGQVVAIGDRRRYVTALMTLDPEAVQTFASRHGFAENDPQTLVSNQALLDEVAAAVERANLRLNGAEKVQKFKLIPQVWIPDTEELTPTAKLKRRNIHVKYAEAIEEMYLE